MLHQHEYIRVPDRPNIQFQVESYRTKQLSTSKLKRVSRSIAIKSGDFSLIFYSPSIHFALLLLNARGTLKKQAQTWDPGWEWCCLSRCSTCRRTCLRTLVTKGNGHRSPLGSWEYSSVGARRIFFYSEFREWKVWLYFPRGRFTSAKAVDAQGGLLNFKGTGHDGEQMKEELLGAVKEWVFGLSFDTDLYSKECRNNSEVRFGKENEEAILRTTAVGFIFLFLPSLDLYRFELSSNSSTPPKHFDRTFPT